MTQFLVAARSGQDRRRRRCQGGPRDGIVDRDGHGRRRRGHQSDRRHRIPRRPATRSPAFPPGPDFTFPTGAYPNQLNNIALKGSFVYVPNTGASPNGPVRFDVNTQSLLSVIDRATSARAPRRRSTCTWRSRPDRALAKRFLTEPWAIAFKHAADEGYVVSAASNIVVKVAVDPATGPPTVQNDPARPDPRAPDPRRQEPARDRRQLGRHARLRDELRVARRDRRRLTASPERVIATMRSADAAGAGHGRKTRSTSGKELYNTSIGGFDPRTRRRPPIVGRMSKNGWGACSACHPFGLSDNVVWIFPAGPRRTIPQHTDFDPTDPTRSRCAC